MDRTYTLVLDTNAQCRIEDATGLAYPIVLQAIAQGNRSVLRQWVKAALVDPPNPSLDDVGTIIDDIGGYDVMSAGFVEGTKRPKKGRRAR